MTSPQPDTVERLMERVDVLRGQMVALTETTRWQSREIDEMALKLAHHCATLRELDHWRQMHRGQEQELRLTLDGTGVDEHHVHGAFVWPTYY